MKNIITLFVFLSSMTMAETSFGCYKVGPACVATQGGFDLLVPVSTLVLGSGGKLTLGEVYIRAFENGQDLGTRSVIESRGGYASINFPQNSPHGTFSFYFYDLHGNYLSNFGTNFQIQY